MNCAGHPKLGLFGSGIMLHGTIVSFHRAYIRSWQHGYHPFSITCDLYIFICVLCNHENKETFSNQMKSCAALTIQNSELHTLQSNLYQTTAWLPFEEAKLVFQQSWCQSEQVTVSRLVARGEVWCTASNTESANGISLYWPLLQQLKTGVKTV